MTEACRAALSNERTEVVPTAITLPPRARHAFTSICARRSLQLQIDFSLIEIDSGYHNADTATELKYLARALTNEALFGLLEVVIVAGQCADMHQPFDI